jgi:butyryl-CoA dehydrogenase
MARAAYEAADACARKRKMFGTAIIDNHSIASRLADMAANIEAARQLTWHAASLKDAGLPCLNEASMAKRFAFEAAEKICGSALQMLGGYGFARDFPVERIYRNVRAANVHESSIDVQRAVLAQPEVA